MSGIARNTLRFIGAAKYPHTMKLTNNDLNNSLALLQPQYLNYNGSTQAIQTLTTFESAVHAVREKVFSLFASKPKVTVETEEVKEAKTGLLKVSLSSGKVKLIGVEEIRKPILHPTFNMQLNGQSIEPESDKTAEPDDKGRFNFDDKWHISRDGDNLIFKLKNRGETFILKHAVNIIAHEKPLTRKENSDCNVTSEKTISDVSSTNAKLLSKSDQSQVFVRYYPPLDRYLIPLTFTEDKITDGPNRQGKMKLKFPMTASLEGAQQVIKMKNSDDYCTVNHTVDVQTYKRLPENGINEFKAEVLEEKVNILRMELESGDLIIESIASKDQWVVLKQKSSIEINLDSEVPFIHIVTSIKIQERLD